MAERNTDGTFAAGNSGGPGRPPRPVERDYLRCMVDVCGVDVWRQIAERAVADALEGDAAARTWLTKYLLGPPDQSLVMTMTPEEQTAAGQDVPSRIASDLFAELAQAGLT